MPLAIGTQLGSHEITALLGKGGMGEVYRARDLKLKREVAIKILPEEFARDTDRVSRFQREAEVLASLNHPNIAAIHEFEETNGTRYLVLELVEGETLADRIARGQVSVQETLIIARQICDALEAAHQKGIIHRDLKPANIKLTPDGKVKVLDFGLAKAIENSPANAALSNSPTVINSFGATKAGVIIGTAAYMSPEQARGFAADARSDIFALGCVLYEMLTGHPTFQGETVTEVLAGILKSEPDWQRLPAYTPPAVRRLLRRCLQKDRNRRLHSSADLRIEIEEVDSEPEVGQQSISRPRVREGVAWIVTVVLVIALAAVSTRIYLRKAAEAPEIRVDIVTPSTADPISFALSPDGRRLAFVASGDGQPRLWLRPLDSVKAQALGGTEGASYPFWSPDSRSLGFFAAGKLKRIDIGGSPQTLADAAQGRGGTWTPDAGIVFSATGSGPLLRVPSSGGATTPVTKLASGQTSHRFPSVLPDGHRFIFYAGGTESVNGIYLGSLDSQDTKRLMASDTAAGYLPGWLLSVRNGTLVAWPFDPSRGETVGEPRTVADPVGFDSISVAGAFSASLSGAVAYRSDIATRRQLTWFDRSGKPIGTVGTSDENGLADPELSPDGARIAIDRNVQNNTDVWIFNGSRSIRFTFDPGQDALPVWSPDGTRIVFRSTRKGSLDLFEKPSSNASDEQLLVLSDQYKTPTDWSSDGRFILYTSTDPKTGNDLWVLPTDKGKQPFIFLQTPYDEKVAHFSPDGRWVAYQSNQTGRFEIYVRPFPGPGGQWQLSTLGGTHPRWGRDGKELFYLAADGKLMSVPIVVRGETVEPGDAIALFQTRIVTTTTSNYRAQYDVSKDGRFLINVPAEDATTSPITLLLNWNHPER